MLRSTARSFLFAGLATALGCAPEVSPPAADAGPDSGPAVMDAGHQQMTTDAGPTDAGVTCPPAYPLGTLAGLDCDPMSIGQCGMPFPSNVYLQANNNSPTCFNVNFTSGMLPELGTTPTNPSAWNDSDGFSPGQAPMTYMPGATATGMADQNHVSASLDLVNSPTLIIDTSTTPPSAVPQFSEIDVTDTESNEAILIHPMIRLKDATRYIVVIRNVVNASGTALPANPTFQALRDGTAAPMIPATNGSGMMTDPTVASRTALYANIFSVLTAAGVSKSNLQIAWDYTTASKQNNTGQLESMYTQALAALPAGGPSYTIVSAVEPTDDPYVAKRIRGLISVPLFLDAAKVTIDIDPLVPDLSTGYTLQRDSNGNPKMNGFGQFEFIVEIPKAATASTAVPLPILIQGHGLFGDRSEGQDGFDTHYNNTLLLAQNQGYVTIAMDMIGWRSPNNSDLMYGTTQGSSDGYWPMDWGANPDTNAEDDQEKAGGFVSADIGNFKGMVDRGTQGLLNELIAVKMMETSFAADTAVMIGPGNQSVIDTTQAFYRGDSQGGITGISFMALTKDCKRGWLGEPGMPYSLLFMRSQDFSQFLSTLLGNYSTGNPAMNVEMVVGLMQMFLDRWEGDGFAPYISENMLSLDTPVHHVMIVDGVGDHQVTPLGAHILARTIGAQVLNPQVATMPWDSYDLPGVTGPFSGNAIQEWDFGILTDSKDTVPQTDTPPTGPDDPHDWTRLAPAAYLETDRFLKTGQALDFCGTLDGGQATACVYPPGAPTGPNGE